MKKDNTIPLITAKAWTKEWRSRETANNPNRKCNAFLIPAEVLEAVLAEIKNQPGNKLVRAYLGLDKSSNEEKLIIVGTQPEPQNDGKVIYRDIINGVVDGTELEGAALESTELEQGSGIWDFSKPCPPECDPNSPLS